MDMDIKVGNRRHISPSVKKLLLNMSRIMKTKDIAESTGYSRQTVWRVRHLWETSGDVANRSIEWGRPRVLSPLDVDVSDIVTLDYSKLINTIIP